MSTKLTLKLVVFHLCAHEDGEITVDDLIEHLPFDDNKNV